MSLHKGIDKFVRARSALPKASAGPWQFQYPNAADFNFNYWKLLDGASAIAQNANPQLRCAIVGAGVSGLVAARELLRCGVTNIDVYEASDRIGGRTYSIPANGPPRIFADGSRASCPTAPWVG